GDRRVCHRSTLLSPLSEELGLAGIRRNVCTRSWRPITRRSQVQIRPPLLRKAPETAPFAFYGDEFAEGARSNSVTRKRRKSKRGKTGCLSTRSLPERIGRRLGTSSRNSKPSRRS